MPAQMVIDQAGLPAGTLDRARSDGLSGGEQVTLTSGGGGSTHRFNLLWVPASDSTAVSTLTPTGTPNIWTFSPTPNVYGSYRVELIVDEALPTESRSIRIFAVRTPNQSLRIPALNERADPRASLTLNGTDQIAASEDNENGSYSGWQTSLRELYLALENANTTTLQGVADLSGLSGLAPAGVVAAVVPKWADGVTDAPGIWTYNATRTKNDHDGGTVVSPTVPYTTPAAFLAGTGETDPGGVGVWERQMSGEPYNVKWFGAVGDGATDDTGSVQATLDAVPTGHSVTLAGGRHLITSSLALGKDNVLIHGPGALIETTELDSTMVVTGVSRVAVHRVDLEGAEDNATWNAATPAERQVFKQFFEFVSCAECSVSKLRSSNKRGTVTFTNSVSCSGESVVHEGFLGPISVSQPDANFYTVIRDLNGTQNRFRNIDAEGSGSVVLGGNETSELGAINVTGRDCHDNGVYISSGNDGQITVCNIISAVGSGVKVRGSRHILTANNARDCLLGIDITGNGVTPDADGANGHGCIAADNIITDPRASGVLVGSQDGLLCRDVTLDNNIINNHLGAGANAAIRASVVRGMTMVDNKVIGFASDYGVLMAGVVAAPAEDCIVESNTIRGGAEGMRLLYLEDAKINGNVFADITGQIIQGRFVNNSLVTVNKGTNNCALGIRLNSSFSCTGNRVLNNDAATNGSDGALNEFGGNNNDIYPSVGAATPLRIGQIVVNGSTFFGAVGTASPADWISF